MDKTISQKTTLMGKKLRRSPSSRCAVDSYSHSDAAVHLCVMVTDLPSVRSWISHSDKDTYCSSLRRRLRREVASLDKVRTIKYYQFPQRPATTRDVLNTPLEDEDQTDVFMYRTNTRLSFKPFRIGGSPRHSRNSDSRPAGKPYYNYKEAQGQPYKNLSKAKVVELSESPTVFQNYQSFRPGTFLTGANRPKSPKVSISQSSYYQIGQMRSISLI